jgi:aryl-alcohol dehydrogenase-like predicted oxidoreductase
MHRLRDEGKVRFVGLSDWDGSKIMQYVERVDPDAVQPYRNLVDDDYESSGLKAYVDAHDLGVAFFSPLKHGLLLRGDPSATTLQAVRPEKALRREPLCRVDLGLGRPKGHGIKLVA